MKLRLQARRWDDLDAGDPLFAEALEAAKNDPELAAWLREQEEFDAVIAEKCREFPVPEEIRERLLHDVRSQPRRQAVWWRRPAFAGPALAAAALLTIGLFVRTAIEKPRSASEMLGLEAIGHSSRMPPLEFVCFDAAAVTGWVNRQPMIEENGFRIEKKMTDMKLIGASTAEWNGKPVVMLSLQNGKQMAMFYILRAGDFPGVDDEEDFVSKDGWISRVSKSGAALRVLSTRGTREDLDFEIPY